MKTAIMKLIVVTALSFSGAALAAETGSKVQHPAVKPVAPAPAPAMPTAPGKPAKAKLARSKSLDLRHCLDLKTNAAIAKCAGE